MTGKEEQKNLLIFYGLFAASVAVTLVPSLMLALAALVLFTGLLIAAYKMRSKAEKESLTAHHMTYIIRTVWIASLFALVTVAVASVYVLALYDPGPMQDCANRAVNALMDNATAPPGMMEIDAMLQPCMAALLETNRNIFLAGTLIAGSPLLLYMGWRLYKGFTAARRGALIAGMEKWF